MTDAVSIACCSSARDTFFLPYSQHYHCLVSITLLFNFTPLQQGNSLKGIDNTTVRNRDLEQAVQIRIFGAFAHLFLLLQYIVGLLPITFWGLRNNWYQSYNCTIIKIGAQRPQSCPIAWPNLESYILCLRISVNTLCITKQDGSTLHFLFI